MTNRERIEQRYPELRLSRESHETREERNARIMRRLNARWVYVRGERPPY